MKYMYASSPSLPTDKARAFSAILFESVMILAVITIYGKRIRHETRADSFSSITCSYLPRVLGRAFARCNFAWNNQALQAQRPLLSNLSRASATLSAY